MIKNFRSKYKILVDQVYEHPLWKRTSWFLATGAPSSGKSTSLRHLQKVGYKVNSDISRDYIVDLKERGVTFEKSDLYSSETQQILFFLMTADALALDTDQMIIHDYSLPDNIAFLSLGGLPVPDEVKKSAKLFRFQKVFLFEPLELVRDGIRTEDREDQEKLFHLLHRTYRSIGYDPILVKSDTVKKRHEFLLKNLPKI